MKKIVYTANYGNYDTLKDPTRINIDWDYICFTDNPNLKSKVYEIVHLPSEFKDKAYMARKVKLQPHLFLPKHSINIWHDCSMKMLLDPDKLVEDHGKKDFTIMNHPFHWCAYAEAKLCGKMGKDDQKIIGVQMQRYFNERMPQKLGLVASGVQIRKNNKANKTFLDLWWNEVENGSKRDQLSFNYIAWKTKFDYHMMPFAICKGNYLQIEGHLKRKR